MSPAIMFFLVDKFSVHFMVILNNKQFCIIGV